MWNNIPVMQDKEPIAINRVVQGQRANEDIVEQGLITKSLRHKLSLLEQKMASPHHSISPTLLQTHCVHT